MQSEIRIFSRPKGEIQRVQLVHLDSWSELDFLTLHCSAKAMDCFSMIYRQFLVPACPWLFGNMVMFHLPEDLEAELPFETRKYGAVANRITAAAAALEQGVRIVGGKPRFRDELSRKLWQALEQRDSIRIVSGKLPITTIIPVGNAPGFLSQEEKAAALKVNASFFIMDRFDCSTLYDHIGTVLGLCVKDGVVENPPMYRREALLVRKDGRVSVEIPDVREMVLEIRGQKYAHGKNARINLRPDRSKTPKTGKKQLVIIGCRVEAVVTDSGAHIPTSGFVLCPEGDCDVQPGDRVTYRGMEDVTFGIQVGNSIVRDGEKTMAFQSRYYNIRHLEPVPFPPSLYPLNFSRDRAARIALGADGEGKPLLLWAEGAAKIGHTPGRDSCGATLADMADICAELGMVNAINLDGGGSAQILLHNRRHLWISDRKAKDHSESERPVPNGLIVR